MFQTENYASTYQPAHLIHKRFDKAKRRGKKIVLEANGVMILSVLFCVSVSAVFYLGLSLGRTDRIVKSVFKKDEAEKVSASPLQDNLQVLSVNDKSLAIAAVDKKIDMIDQNLNTSLATAEKNLQQEAQLKTSHQESAAPHSKELYAVQVSSLNNIQGANMLLKQLKEGGYDAYIVSGVQDNGSKVYRIRVGSNLAEKSAKEMLKNVQVSMAGLAEPVLIKLP